MLSKGQQAAAAITPRGSHLRHNEPRVCQVSASNISLYGSGVYLFDELALLFAGLAQHAGVFDERRVVEL